MLEFQYLTFVSWGFLLDDTTGKKMQTQLKGKLQLSFGDKNNQLQYLHCCYPSAMITDQCFTISLFPFFLPFSFFLRLFFFPSFQKKKYSIIFTSFIPNSSLNTQSQIKFFVFGYVTSCQYVYCRSLGFDKESPDSFCRIHDSLKSCIRAKFRHRPVSLCCLHSRTCPSFSLLLSLEKFHIFRNIYHHSACFHI